MSEPPTPTTIVKKKKDGNAPAAKPAQKRISAAQLRLTRDINETSLPPTCQVEFPDKDDLMNFKLVICPDEGYYEGGRFVFSFAVGQSYPHDPPKVKCETKVYHPNIDLDGNVCLNILREDWKPVLTVNSVIYGLQFLFLDPNPEDPLNKSAAELLSRNPNYFANNVKTSIRGGYVDSTYFKGCRDKTDYYY